MVLHLGTWTFNGGNNANITGISGNTASGTSTSLTATLSNSQLSQQSVVYNVAYVTNSGCSVNINTPSIAVNPRVTVAASSASPSTICKGNTSNLSVTTSGGSGAITHNWTLVNANGTGATLANLSPTNSATPVFTAGANITQGGTVVYQDNISDAVGCATTVQVSIVVGAPVATIVETDGSGTSNDSKLCAGASATLTGPTSAGSPAFSYAWATSSGTVASPVASATSVTPSASSTTYTLTVTQSGCQATANTTISANTVALTATSSASPSTVCKGSTSDITAVPSGGTGSYTHNWTLVNANSTVCNFGKSYLLKILHTVSTPLLCYTKANCNIRII